MIKCILIFFDQTYVDPLWSNLIGDRLELRFLNRLFPECFWGTFFLTILMGHFFDNFVGTLFFGQFSWDTFFGTLFGTLFFENFVGTLFFGQFSWDTFLEQFCWDTFLRTLFDQTCLERDLGYDSSAGFSVSGMFASLFLGLHRTRRSFAWNIALGWT